MREMMTTDTEAGIGLGDIPGVCIRLGRQMPESLHDPWHQLMDQSCGLAQISNLVYR